MLEALVCTRHTNTGPSSIQQYLGNISYSNSILGRWNLDGHVWDWGIISANKLFTIWAQVTEFESQNLQKFLLLCVISGHNLWIPCHLILSSKQLHLYLSFNNMIMMMLWSKHVLIMSHTLIGRKTKTKKTWRTHNQEIDMLALKVTSQITKIRR